MSDLYVSTDGFKPLPLPVEGEDLQPGRQYLLTPLVRLILDEVYGFRGVPTVVECLHARRPATIIRTMVQDAESGKTLSSSIMEVPAREATFRAFLGKGRVLKFEVSLARLADMAPFYDKSHKLPLLEEEWFAATRQYPVGQKFRGQPLRWWDRGAPVGRQVGAARRLSSVKPDISVLFDL